jgi:hypothetical protein
MFDEINDSWQVVLWMLFNVVVACHFNEIWLEIFIDDVFVHLVRVTNVDDFVAHAMDYVDWAISILLLY